MSTGIHQNISVNCVILGFDLKCLQVLLMERVLRSDLNQKPIFSDHSLPEDRILDHEDLEETPRRILKELTGMDEIYLEQFRTFTRQGQLMNEKDRLWLQSNGYNLYDRLFAIGYFGLLDIHAMENTKAECKTEWFPVDQLPDLAFGHGEIVHQAVESLRKRMRISTIGYLLLPKKFSLSQLQTLFEVVHGIQLDKRNFRKRMIRMKYLIPLNEKQSGVSHKPARLYMFSREVYEMTRKDLFENIT